MGCQQKSLFLLVAAAMFVHSSTSGEELTQNTLKNQRLPGLDVCGKSEVSDQKIVKGTPAKLGEFPWIAAIGFKELGKNGSIQWGCGGSILTDQYVITAAHCIYPDDESEVVTVRLGDLDLNPAANDGANYQDFEIEELTYHEGYVKTKHINDIGLIKLKTKITFTDKIGPICLPPPEFHTNTYEGYSPVVAGWGNTLENDPSNTVLMKAEVRIKNTAECSQNYTLAGSKSVIDDRVICASAPGKDSCAGDSGGPLMFYKNTPGTGNTYLMGTVSYGRGCARENFPGVYMRVSEYMDWIIDHLDI